MKTVVVCIRIVQKECAASAEAVGGARAAPADGARAQVQGAV